MHILLAKILWRKEKIIENKDYFCSFFAYFSIFIKISIFKIPYFAFFVNIR